MRGFNFIIMTRQTAINIICEVIEKNFETSDQDYSKNIDEPIYYSINTELDFIEFYHEINSLLSKVEGFENVHIDSCDSINDIINNNFNFN